jgi:hypothetical protein
VTDYGVRLTVRVGNLSPLACAPFRVFLLYTVSPLRGGRFHRPFQGFSAPRYVSTTADILIEPSSTSVESVSEFVKGLQGLVTRAVTSIYQASKTAEGYANRSRREFQFGVGDAVLLSTKYFIPEAFRERKRKFSANFSGPYEIIEVISPVSYRIQLPVGKMLFDRAGFSPDLLHNRPEAARYLLTLVTDCSDQSHTHAV